MDKLIKKLDELFAKYGVSEEEVQEVGVIIANIGGDELNMEGEYFEAPEVEEEYAEVDEEVED